MWKSTHRKPGTQVLTGAAVVVFGAFLGTTAWGATDNGQAANTQATPESQAAVWTPKELEFTYMGFTTRYSCDGLRDKIREILLDLGARKSDLRVSEQPCPGIPDRPQPLPGVKIKMSVLQPASDQNSGAPTVEAHWKTINLLRYEQPLDRTGQCELLEQVHQKILPLFTTRNVDLQAGCVPHQLQPLNAHLQAEVLITDQHKKADKQASAAEVR